MSREPNVYIALEYEGGQLTVHGPLELLDRLVTTLAGPGRQWKRLPQPAGEPQEAPRDAGTNRAAVETARTAGDTSAGEDPSANEGGRV